MEVFKPIKVENYQFMKNGLNQFTLKMMKKKVRYMATLEGFRNFDLKNLQIKKNRKIRKRDKDNNRVLVRIIEKK